VNVFILGAGYSAAAIAAALRPVAASIAGTRRSRAAFEATARAGITPLLFDGGHATPDVIRALRSTTHLLCTIAPDAGGDPALRVFGDTIAREMPALEWIGYLSTTGVYGDHGGAWVDETAVCAPTAERSIRRLATEQAWSAAACRRGASLAILRLPGIYGPGRNVLAGIASGAAKRIVKPGHVFSRVHVEDIGGAAALLAAGRTDGIFNIADHEPAPAEEVLVHAARLMAVEPPPEVPLDSADVSPGLRAFYAESRRVCNRRIRELGYTFRYPDYRSGLAALWRDGEGTG
jgi:hypothetical protein